MSKCDCKAALLNRLYGLLSRVPTEWLVVGVVLGLGLIVSFVYAV